MKDYLNCKERHEDMIDHCSFTHNLSTVVVKLKPEKKFRPEWEFCNTGAVL